MYKFTFISIISFISVLLSSCKESNEDLLQTLRSENDIYYNQNNQEAIRRVESIMYNNTNLNNIYERFKIVHISDTH
ncbi:MAG: metallophosphoesterase, partial [Parabacteroides sp.]|nr:metallophosphoesterase [Parabacteroides sp.]